MINSISSVMVVGLGLIGGSLAQLIRERYPDVHLMGVDIDSKTREYAQEKGVVTDVFESIIDCRFEPDLVIVALPISAVNTAISQVVDHFAHEMIISDVSSIKKEIGDGIIFKDNQVFISGHPMAGLEVSGIENADSDILRGATYFLIESDHPTFNVLKQFLSDMLFRVVPISRDQHDDVVAYASHWPYLMAVLTVASTSAYDDLDLDVFRKAISSGFRDTTRVADSAPEWGRDVLMRNQSEIRRALSTLKANIDRVEKALINLDHDALERFITSAKSFRASLYSS